MLSAVVVSCLYNDDHPAAHKGGCPGGGSAPPTKIHRKHPICYNSISESGSRFAKGDTVSPLFSE